MVMQSVKQNQIYVVMDGAGIEIEKNVCRVVRMRSTVPCSIPIRPDACIHTYVRTYIIFHPCSLKSSRKKYNVLQKQMSYQVQFNLMTVDFCLLNV